MTINSALRASATGLFAERMRMDAISSNIANANSMSTPGQEAYRRKIVILEAGEEGVTVSKLIDDPTPLRGMSDPTNPMADEEGMVYFSNVNPILEMVDLMGATRSYEANVAAFNSSKSMLRAALNIGRV